MKIQDVELEWLTHVKNSFPRELFRWREVVNSDVLFVSRIRENFGRFDIFSSVYPTDAREKGVVDTLFLDMDGENLSKVHREMRKLVRHSTNRLDYEPRVYFSGKKGFHFYFDFEPVELRANFRQMATKFLEFLEVPHDHIDWHVVGDIQRISRVPFTIHTKSRRMCTPIDPSWTLKRILSQSKKCRIEKTVEIHESDTIRSLIEEYNDPDLYPEPTFDMENRDVFEANSIRTIIFEEMRKSHPPHAARLAFVVEAFYNGWTKDEIVGAFTHIDDFDPERTAYFVGDTIKKIKMGLKPWRNSTLVRYGIKGNSSSKVYIDSHSKVKRLEAK